MDAVNWRKASYSAGNGGGCVEAGTGARRVLVRDTQDRSGPVLRFSPAAWRRFAAQVRRSLAVADLIEGTRTWRGIPVLGVPLRRARWFLACRARARRGRFPSVRGLVVFGSVVARGAPSGGGGQRGSGGTGNRALGVPGPPGACSFRRPKTRRGIRV